jgi:3-oxoacyl-(acyl-carrier-protein) synthase/thioesterase domain-containing protein/acyl carrier protein
MSEELEGVAVVGLAGRFPGSDDVDALWANLLAGYDGITTFSDEILRSAGVSARELGDPRYVRRWGALRDADCFDAEHFRITRRDAELLDPQQRLFLEHAWRALESAGHLHDRRELRTGVYGGVGFAHYLHQQVAPDFRGLGESTFHRIYQGNDKDFVCTRVAHALDLTGPAINVQTACSTSLVAIATAALHLLTHQCDLALAGGASIRVPLVTGYLAEEGGISSPDGVCRAFDAGARGAVWGNAVGVVALRRLADAIADGDFIWAVIKGFGLSNDGARKAGFHAPSAEGQLEAISCALSSAGFDARSIGFVEAHGTGTPLGDPIEVSALTRAFRMHGGEGAGFCALGSVKTNLGHTDAAAGVTGFIKAALAVHHGLIPPTRNFERANPMLDLASSPFFVNREVVPFTGQPRRAGVSSFGIGGTNAHVVLEEAPARAVSRPVRGPLRLPLSARTPAALDRSAAALASWLHVHRDANLGEVASSLRTRERFEHRRVVSCANVDEAIAALARPAVAASTEAFDAALCDEDERRPKLSLPTYPFERIRHWIERTNVETEAPSPNALHRPRWRELATPKAAPFDAIVVRWPATDGSAKSAMKTASAGLQMLQTRLREDRPSRVVWVTERAFAVSDAERPDPALAALAALGRSHRNESSHVALTIVDADDLDELRDEDLAAAIATSAPEIAIRGRRLFTPHLEPVATVSTPHAAIGPVFVTGGVGALGLRVAEHLVTCHGVTALALASRHAPNEAQTAAIDALRARGAAIDVLQLDVGDRVALERVLAGRRFATIVHAAGVLEDATIGRMSDDQLARVFRAKVEGAFALHELADDDTRLVFFSSISGVFGAPGQGAYAAANAYMDALAAVRRARGAPSWSIAWSPWKDSGMWAALAERDRARAERRGLVALPSAEALALFESALGSSSAIVVVTSSEVSDGSFAEPTPAKTVSNEGGTLALVRAEVGRLLGRASTDPVPLDTRLPELGFDSLMAVELRSALASRLGVTIPAGALFDAPGVRALAEHLERLVSGPARSSAKLASKSIRRLGSDPTPPLFLIGGAVGGDELYLSALADAIGVTPPCFALLYPGMTKAEEPLRDVLALADHFAAAVTETHPEGPIAVGGHSLGGLVAFELAHRLAALGRTVVELVLLDPPMPGENDAAMRAGPWNEATLRSYLDRLAERGWLPPELASLGGSAEAWALLERMWSANAAAMRNYRPSRAYHGEATLLTPADASHGMGFAVDAWRNWCPALKVARTGGNHIDMVREPHVHRTARLLRSLFSTSTVE